MIRDPSDGTVYEPLDNITTDLAKPTIGHPAGESGLPAGSQKEKNLKRLEESRAWLKSYHERRGK